MSSDTNNSTQNKEWFPKHPMIVNYLLTSYVRGQENVEKHIRMDITDVPIFIEKNLSDPHSHPGLWLEWILIISQSGCD